MAVIGIKMNGIIIHLEGKVIRSGGLSNTPYFDEKNPPWRSIIVILATPVCKRTDAKLLWAIVYIVSHRTFVFRGATK